MKVRAISLHQPWASAIAVGAKRFETRHWETNYRGPLAIHAAQSRSLELRTKFYQLMVVDEIRSKFAADSLVEFGGLPFGAVVCVADLTDCVRVESVRADVGAELLLGNYLDGRFAWKLENVRRFKNPVVISGRQRFFHVDIDLNSSDLIKVP